MASPELDGRALARRLRALREEGFSGRRLTQRDLAEALGGDDPLSVPLISSWESLDKPVTPPENRLEAYARFFATIRSMTPSPRLIPENELSEEELGRRDALLSDLLDLRQSRAVAGRSTTYRGNRIPLAAPLDEIGGGPWYFEDQRPVTIVCARLPDEMIGRMPYTNPRDPDYVKLYTYADVDSLVELHGHIRAVNPASRVNIRTPQELTTDDLTCHLAILGGVDWNGLTRDVSRSVHIPVRQKSRTGDTGEYGGYFEVDDGDSARELHPKLDSDERGFTLREDIAQFFRGTNPFNSKRTVTICNGMFGRGTYGAVRALTDVRFRDRNASFIRNRFGNSDTFSIVARVLVVRGETVTPDWTHPENRLHEWPDSAGELR